MVLLLRPAPRWKSMMAELPTSSELVLFGGQTTAESFSGVYSYNGLLNDTFSFNGTSWSLVSAGLSGNTLTSPSPRYDCAASFDGTYITFVGGSDGRRNLSSTYSYSTSGGWFKQPLTDTLESPIGGAPSYGVYPIPTTLSGASMAYQSGNSGGECILFGGEASYQRHLSLDSWVWATGNPGTWTLLSPSTWPQARKWSPIASSATTAVMFGGYGMGTTGFLSDTWIWNGSAYTQITGFTPGVNCPSPRYGHSFAYDASSSQYVLFGGITAQGYDFQTWVFSTGSNTWTNLTSGIPGQNAPAGRAFGAMAYLTATSSVYMFGGLGPITAFGDTWSFASNTWTLLG